MLILLIASIIIVIGWHELGHLSIAKLFGVGVQEYSIGVGPKLLEFRIGTTRYALRLLPFGGFVDMADWIDCEDPKSLQRLEPVERAMVKRKSGWFANHPLYERVAVDFAGPAFNIVLAIFIFIVVGLPHGFHGNLWTIISTVWSAESREAVLGFHFDRHVGAVNHFYGFWNSWQMGLPTYLRHIAILNLGLAGLNLLPIPPLDGSQILKELFFEAHHGGLKGRKLAQARRSAMSIWGTLALIGLIFVIVVQFFLV